MGKEILFARVDLSTRDALHAAARERYGVEEIPSFDAGFDQLPGIHRIHD